MSLLKVDISEISIKTDNNRKILSDINFSIEPSNIYSISGNNGSGKTTLLLSIANLLNKNLFTISGSIFIDGTEYFPKNKLHVPISNFLRLVFQHTSLMFDPLKKLSYYIKMIDDKILLQILFVKSQLPDINRIAEKHIYEFSEGQSQRIALCLSIAAHPKLLILDEPTSSLDPINIGMIANLIHDFINMETAVLIVTHDQNFASSISDYVGYIINGHFQQFNRMVR